MVSVQRHAWWSAAETCSVGQLFSLFSSRSCLGFCGKRSRNLVKPKLRRGQASKHKTFDRINLPDHGQPPLKLRGKLALPTRKAHQGNSRPRPKRSYGRKRSWPTTGGCRFLMASRRHFFRKTSPQGSGKYRLTPSTVRPSGQATLGPSLFPGLVSPQLREIRPGGTSPWLIHRETFA